MNNSAWMVENKVSDVVKKMAIPSVISSLVTVVYNMADTFFVGQTQDPLQVAAVSLTNPIFILFMAVANMLGMGGSAIASTALGRKDKTKVKNVSSFVTYISLIVGIFFCAILLLFPNALLSLFGANADTMDLAKGYTFYIAWGAPFIIFSAAASFIVRAQGDSKEAMIGSMIGTIINIVLDPIFVSVFHQGAAGAAIATTLGNILASLYYIYYFEKKSKIMSIRFKYFSMNVFKSVCLSGLPMALFSSLMSISTILINLILVQYGNSAVAAVGIVFKANMFVTFLQMGLANGVQPILGYCYGSGSQVRFKEVEKYTKKCCLICGVILSAVYIVFRSQIIQIFINDTQTIEYGIPLLVGYTLSGPFIGLLFMNMNVLQTLNHPMYATVLSLFRQGLLFIPLLFIFNVLFGFTGDAIAQSVTDIVTILLSIILRNRVIRQVESTI